MSNESCSKQCSNERNVKNLEFASELLSSSCKDQRRADKDSSSCKR